jgi:hypothetical protein
MKSGYRDMAKAKVVLPFCDRIIEIKGGMKSGSV